jgi:hypothetical protein
MKLLPPRTELPDEPLQRSHGPTRADYTKYRDCARWDFGFSCSLCFLHESDLIEGGADGAALIWLEHHELKSEAKERRDEYTNCLLSCRFCNNGRSTLPNRDPHTGAVLLDPTREAWALRFRSDGSSMVVRYAEDKDANYTWALYGLGDERKTALRENRARRFDAFRRAEQSFVELVPALLAKAEQSDAPREVETWLQLARELEQSYENLLAEVVRYLATPHDAPASCRCAARRELPAWLARQTQAVEEASGLRYR